MIIFFLFLNRSIYFLIIKIWNLLPQNSISNICRLPHFGITFSQQRKTIKHWMSLPGEVVWSLTLEIFKTRQNNAMSNLVKPCNWPCFQQEDGWYPEVPSRLNYFMIPQALRQQLRAKTPNICSSDTVKQPSGWLGELQEGNSLFHPVLWALL